MLAESSTVNRTRRNWKRIYPLFKERKFFIVYSTERIHTATMGKCVTPRQRLTRNCVIDESEKKGLLNNRGLECKISKF